MSIINQALRDLDARKGDPSPSPSAGFAVANSLRSGPARWMAAGGLLALAGLAAWLALPYLSAERQAAESTDAPPAAPPVAIEAAPIQAPAVVAPVPVRHEPVAQVQAATEVAPERPAPVHAVNPVAASPGREVAAKADQHESQHVLKLAESLPARLPSIPAITREARQPTPEEDAEERYRKAMTLVNKGREIQARPLLQEAVKLHPGHVAARQVLATLLNEAGANREAEALLQDGMAASPDVSWFALSLARLQASRGDVEAAVRTMQGGLSGRGVNADYRAAYAAWLAQLNQHAEAARQYEMALKQHPGQGAWWAGLGLAQAAQGMKEASHSAYERALKAGNLPPSLEAFVRSKLAD